MSGQLPPYAWPELYESPNYGTRPTERGQMMDTTPWGNRFDPRLSAWEGINATYRGVPVPSKMLKEWETSYGQHWRDGVDAAMTHFGAE